MADTLTIIARLTAAEGAAETLQTAITKMVLRSRAEKGCIRYVATRGVDDPNVFILIEEWRSRDLWEVHRAGPTVTEFRASLPEGTLASSEVHPLTTIA